jgi:hypothetical protein
MRGLGTMLLALGVALLLLWLFLQSRPKTAATVTTPPKAMPWHSPKASAFASTAQIVDTLD